MIAVGGNALTREDQEGTPAQIEDNARQMAAGIARLCEAGWRIVVVHGNGPQVGNLAIQQEGGAELVPGQPLDILNAMTQGQLGSVLVRAIDALRGPGTAVALVSHMVVEVDDPAFGHPTKPIGPFFPADRSTELAARRGWVMTEDSGRGYRRVVASPQPVRLLESAAVELLVRAGHVVLAAGGGGVPVSHGEDGRFDGVEAVIDKDAAAARLAASLEADALVLLTAVDAVSIDFGTPHARSVSEMSVALAESYLAQGQFPPGSMGPKVRAAADFARHGGAAVITSAEHLVDALDPTSPVGTRIVAAPVMSPA